jgi:light-regulated signal transduction histidine kinase (bacteriophytochrome)
VFLSSVELGGGERLFTASVRDLTLDVNLRLVEQSMRELERFTSVAAHDLQEPLRRVETFSDLLVSSIELTSEEEPIVGSMVRAVRQMRSLVRDLLNYTTSTLSDMRMERIDLDELVGEVVAELRDRIDEAGASVEIGRLPTVVGDRDQLGQLFRYLIDNALKYRRPDVEATIGVSADPGGPGSDHHEIKVEDNGIGFEQQHAEQIFEVFRRLHPTGVYDGTGVGLAICRRIAERHGGSIRATGTPGGGAELVVELPVRRLVVADTAPAAEQAVSAGAAAR